MAVAGEGLGEKADAVGKCLVTRWSVAVARTKRRPVALFWRFPGAASRSGGSEGQVHARQGHPGHQVSHEGGAAVAEVGEGRE